MVRGIKWVDEVVEGAPYVTTLETLDRISKYDDDIQYDIIFTIINLLFVLFFFSKNTCVSFVCMETISRRQLMEWTLIILSRLKAVTSEYTVQCPIKLFIFAERFHADLRTSLSQSFCVYVYIFNKGNVRGHKECQQRI